LVKQEICQLETLSETCIAACFQCFKWYEKLIQNGQIVEATKNLPFSCFTIGRGV
jgi:hypothetical protein